MFIIYVISDTTTYHGEPFTLAEVNKALSKTKLNKAAGFDGI